MRQQLRKLKHWKLCSVPNWDWNNVSSDAGRCQQHVLQLLQHTSESTLWLIYSTKGQGGMATLKLAAFASEMDHKGQRCEIGQPMESSLTYKQIQVRKVDLDSDSPKVWRVLSGVPSALQAQLSQQARLNYIGKESLMLIHYFRAAKMFMPAANVAATTLLAAATHTCSQPTSMQWPLSFTHQSFIIIRNVT
eukprot:6213154-Pleurochrysis_carterae.AAC.2